MESSQVIISLLIVYRCHLLCIPSLSKYHGVRLRNNTAKNTFSSVKSFDHGI